MNADMVRWIEAAAAECARKDHASLPELITAFLQAAAADGVKLVPRNLPVPAFTKVMTDGWTTMDRVRWSALHDAAPNYLGDE